jgi:hypothetical protein
MSVREDLDFNFFTPLYLFSSSPCLCALNVFPLLIFSVSLGSNFLLSSISSSPCLLVQISNSPPSHLLCISVFKNPYPIFATFVLIFSVSLCLKCLSSSHLLCVSVFKFSIFLLVHFKVIVLVSGMFWGWLGKLVPAASKGAAAR